MYLEELCGRVADWLDTILLLPGPLSLRNNVRSHVKQRTLNFCALLLK